MFLERRVVAVKGGMPNVQALGALVLDDGGHEIYARNPDREQALRVRLERRNGRLLATPNGPQGSHIVTSLLGADALALVPAGECELEAGATVALEPLPR